MPACLSGCLAACRGLGSAIREIETFTNGKVAAYRIFKIIDRKPVIDSLDEGGNILQNLKGELELSNVHFTYPARPDVPIFKGLNLKIPAARTVALVGTSGSGKSTVIQLIERFYDPSDGKWTCRLVVKFVRLPACLPADESSCQSKQVCVDSLPRPCKCLPSVSESHRSCNLEHCSTLLKLFKVVEVC